jgi:hypothetical protein
MRVILNCERSYITSAGRERAKEKVHGKVGIVERERRAGEGGQINEGRFGIGGTSDSNLSFRLEGERGHVTGNIKGIR